MDAAASTGAPADPMDRPPEPGRRRRPAGLLWASALAAVVLAVAISVAVRNPGPAASSGAPVPDGTGRVNPLLAQGPSLVGQPAPELQLPALTLDPADPAPPDVTLAGLRGRPVVVNFWASTCLPCGTEMPAFQRVHERYGDAVAFVGVDVSDLDSAARSLARRTGVTYPLVTDRAGAALTSFGAATLPTTVVIDPDGIVRTMRAQEMSEDELVAALTPLVS